MSAFKIGDKVVAKVRGFPFWPAKVTNVRGKSVEVFFYGTGEKGKVNASNVKLYANLKAPLSTKKQSLIIAVSELEEELSDELMVVDVARSETKEAKNESNASQNVDSTNQQKRRKAIKSSDVQPNTFGAENVVASNVKTQESSQDPISKPKRKRAGAEKVDAVESSNVKTQESSQDSTSKPKRTRAMKQYQPTPAMLSAEKVDAVESSDVKTQSSQDSMSKSKRTRAIKQGAEKVDAVESSDLKTQSSQDSTIKPKRTRAIKQNQSTSTMLGAEKVDAVESSDLKTQSSQDSTIRSKRTRAIKQYQSTSTMLGAEKVDAVESSDVKTQSSQDSTIKPKRTRAIKQYQSTSTMLGAEKVDSVESSDVKTQESSHVSMTKPKRTRAMKQHQPTPAMLDAEIVDSSDLKTQESSQDSISKPKRKRMMKHAQDQSSEASDLVQPSEAIHEILESSDDPIVVEDEHEQATIDPIARRAVTSLNGESADKLVSKSEEDVIVIEESKTKKTTKNPSNEEERKVSDSINTTETSQIDRSEGIKRSQQKARQINKPKKLVEENGPKPKIISDIDRTLMEANYALIEHFKFEDHEITKAITILNDLSNLKLSKEILKKQFHIVLTIKQLTMYYGKKTQQSRVLRNTATFVLNQLMQYFSSDEDPKETFLREAQEYQSSILSP